MPIHDDETPPAADALARDHRLDRQSPWESEPPITQQSQGMEDRIEQIHRRLLERATRGRLTWAGDRIVRTADLRRRQSPQSPAAMSKLLDKPLTGSTLK